VRTGRVQTAAHLEGEPQDRCARGDGPVVMRGFMVCIAGGTGRGVRRAIAATSRRRTLHGSGRITELELNVLFWFFWAAESAHLPAHSPEHPCPCPASRWWDIKSERHRPLACRVCYRPLSAPDRQSGGYRNGQAE